MGIIKYELVDKAVTSWGGMRMMKVLLDKLEIKEYMKEIALPKPGSNCGYNPIQIIESFWVYLKRLFCNIIVFTNISNI
jgi:hypothetical protein